MDENGAIFSIDAILAIIPVLIMVIAVGNVPTSSNSSPLTPHNVDAQDMLNFLAEYQEGGHPILQKMAGELEINHNDPTGINKASEIVKPILNKFLNGKSYLIKETAQINGPIASQGDIQKSPHISVATRSWGCYTFELQVGSS